MNAIARVRHIIGTARRYLMLLREAELDARRYFRYSTTNGYHPQYMAAQRESELMRISHSIEKSLAMPDFRPRSAKQSVRHLISFLSDDTALTGVRHEIVAVAHAVLAAYQRQNHAAGADVTDLLAGWNAPANLDASLGGTTPWQPADPMDAEAFKRFFRSRHSLRSFDPDRVPDPMVIQRAIDLARHAPSVCNRQTWRVHTFTGSKVQEILALQNGNRGFGHTIPCLLVVTTDLRYFTGTEERYQPWVEGGIFTMALLLALHAEGLGAVPLNWSVTHAQDRDLHQSAQIQEQLRVVALIGCGLGHQHAITPASMTHSLLAVNS
jgi:nitroreductase